MACDDLQLLSLLLSIALDCIPAGLDPPVASTTVPPEPDPHTARIDWVFQLLTTHHLASRLVLSRAMFLPWWPLRAATLCLGCNSCVYGYDFVNSSPVCFFAMEHAH
ncbi:hypothetical protein EVG20_g9104 [Dentipellis fragilis]|uniref:Secreted protein n=1 Tax=Dentipellis fragilis TaxID=205917 RepID=A0A4Y9Y258_9AGAM|nr:hypothetical protein EVG20_g9104 [Dentipellis fragilis]